MGQCCAKAPNDQGDSIMATRVPYGANECAINGLIKDLRKMGLAVKGLKADGDPGPKFDASVASARSRGTETRRFLHSLMFHGLGALPGLFPVGMHQWSSAADDVIATLKAGAKADREKRDDPFPGCCGTSHEQGQG